MKQLWYRWMILLTLIASTSPAWALSGHTDWGAWAFDWEVKDGAGVAIRNVRYQNELVLYKGSMPVIRVKYDVLEDGTTCGPYADRLDVSNLQATTCGSDVCQRSYTLGGQQWLEIGMMAQIGGYQIYQAWYLSADGQIQPHVWSRRYHCQITHDHHAYWRLDFDVNGFPNDQIFVYDNNRPDEGWGPGWHKFSNETEQTKSSSTNRRWFVRDHPTNHGVWVFPGRDDGRADSWSNRDMAGRLYHGAEDEPWPFGANELGYGNNEGLQEKDVVYWYIAHLHHPYPGDPNQWHHAGPLLRVHRQR